MIDRRRFLAVGAAAAGIAASAPARAQPTFTMKVASATINDIQYDFQKRLKERVEQRSGGRIRVELYPASQLGPIPSMVDGVALGTIECFVTATSFLSQMDPRFQVFDVPGLFPTVEQTRAILRDPDLRRRTFAFGAARGLQSIALFLHSPNSILARRPIRSLEDLRGLKIRVLGTPLQVEPMRRLGASPVPLALSEVLPALQTGAIDGLVSASTVVSAFRYYDVAKPLTIVPSWPLICVAVCNGRWLNRLPADLRAVVLEEAEAAERESTAWGEADIVQSQARWRENGGEIVAVTPEFVAALQASFEAATSPLIEASAPLKAEVEVVKAVAARLGAAPTPR